MNGSKCNISTRFTDSASDVDTSFSRENSIPVPPCQSSIFGQTECGEPLSMQHLIFDFTPKEEADNEYVQRKCCSFWDYVNSRNDLRHLMVLPEKNEFSNISNRLPIAKDELETATSTEADHGESKDPTAVSMLDIVEKRGLIDRTFATQLPRCLCSMGSKEYVHVWREYEIKQMKHRRKKECNSSSGFSSGTANTEVKIMCEQLQQWDLCNPKSMEPPGHPPALSSYVYQTKLTT